MLSNRNSLFDDLALSYDEWYETPFGKLVDRLEKEAVFSLVKARPGDLALDLSCGTGNYTLALAHRGLRVVGVDCSEPMLRLAKAKAARLSERLFLIQADATALPFRSRSFDLVTLILGLEFMADPGKAIEEVRRVLKPGACLVVAILNRAGLWTIWRRLKRNFVGSIWTRARFLSEGELQRLLEQRRVSLLQRREAVYFLPVLRNHVRCLDQWEALGRRWLAGRASFLVVSAKCV
ncbi:MAG TPA: methyltransferase domain-containing protein [Methylomirabilota bacterium]|nr:methyltransferase domain-containing protein [Methylomirabilota bacterium]